MGEASVYNLKDEDDEDQSILGDETMKGKVENLQLGKSDSTKQRSKQKKKKSSSVGVRYPSQFMKIGEIKCIFLSCFNRGRSPFLSLGPSWPFTLFLLVLGGLIFGYFVMMISLAQDKAGPMYLLFC